MEKIKQDLKAADVNFTVTGRTGGGLSNKKRYEKF